ncbi:sensor histidine kinase [Paraferrimonas sp. SM1919]|uniref:sensor histidine kinase n=1 Tax=Paraferrimonas sp. SM1919 TaxID=2662263 RepID=UPI0013D3450E|nr:histidine kinase [Paraferrimonas sp. SM1919]
MNNKVTRLDWFVFLGWPLINIGFFLMVLIYLDVIEVRFGSFPTFAGLIITFCWFFGLVSKLIELKFKSQLQNNLSLNLGINFLLGVAAAEVAVGFFPPQFDPMPRFQILGFINLQLQVAIYTIFRHLWRARERALNLELSLKQSELNLLRLQTNPHFLFNTLNLIAGEIHSRPNIAQSVLYDLSDLLRKGVEISSKNQIELTDELQLIMHYLAIQKVRFEERLSYQIDVDASLSKVRIPPMLIVPLVENAIKHVLSKTRQSVFIRVEATLDDKQLTIIVSNSWPFDESIEFRPGSGHQNIHDTLHLLMPDAVFHIEQQNKTVVAQITIPKEK